ncbi:alternative oxidase-domain-containing protein [Chytridium lagenaria]|nr:alternative oxidase-domain-containing protein [Chytridium lagenaria]
MLLKTVRPFTIGSAAVIASTRSFPHITNAIAMQACRPFSISAVRHAHTDTSTTAKVQQAAVHPKAVKQMTHDASNATSEKDYMLRHPVYTKDELEAVKYTHRPVKGLREGLRFDFATNYSDKVGVMNERGWLNRIIFLETVAGVPGMVAGMARHMRSLRSLKRDNGWIITLLEEAENERMHLLTFMKLKRPGPLFRLSVLVTQGIFFNAYFLCYLLAPRACHTFVGYLEESAVHTYTHCLEDIEHGQIKHWGSQPAPNIAKSYWRLKDDATVRDVVAAVRADEADHRDTNHLLSNLDPDQPNPLN